MMAVSWSIVAGKEARKREMRNQTTVFAEVPYEISTAVTCTA